MQFEAVTIELYDICIMHIEINRYKRETILPDSGIVSVIQRENLCQLTAKHPIKNGVLEGNPSYGASL